MSGSLNHLGTPDLTTEKLKSHVGSLAQRCLDLSRELRECVSISAAAGAQGIGDTMALLGNISSHFFDTDFGSHLADHQTHEYRKVEGKLEEIEKTLDSFVRHIQGQGINLDINGVEAAGMRRDLGFQKRAVDQESAFAKVFGRGYMPAPRKEIPSERIAGAIQNLNMIRDKLEYVIMVLGKIEKSGAALNVTSHPEFDTIYNPDKMEDDFFKIAGILTPTRQYVLKGLFKDHHLKRTHDGAFHFVRK